MTRNGPRYMPTEHGRRSLYFCGICLWLAGCSTPANSPPVPPARSVNTITINSVPRSYILRIPKVYNGKAKLPLVMVLHGATDSAEYAEKAYHFVEKAEASGFILVLPDALGENHAWNGLVSADSRHEGKDDLDF